MSVINWRNWDPIPSFNAMVENFFNDEDFYNRWKMAATVPAVNVVESEQNFSVEVAAPGMRKEDFKVEIKDGMLTIGSEKKTEHEEKKENYTRREFSYNTFKRMFHLPENVNPEDVNATYQEGILKLMLPKKVATKPEKEIKKVLVK